MRKAVVDVNPGLLEIVAEYDHGENCAFSPSDCKLTKEDIDTMSATLFKETSGPGYCHLTRADTKRIAAAMAVSIGLEVED